MLFTCFIFRPITIFNSYIRDKWKRNAFKEKFKYVTALLKINTENLSI